MKRLLLFLFMGIGLSLGSWAQTIQLSGTVLDVSGQAIPGFPVFYEAHDSLLGLVDSGMVLTNSSGVYSTVVNATPNANTLLSIFWADCNGAFQTATYQGQPTIVHNIASCITPASCSAQFSFSPSALNPFNLTFWAQNPGPGTYNWNFGDGTAGSGVQINHAYNSSGPFTVCLTVDDGMGCTDTVCQTIFLGSSSNCDASFNAIPDTTQQPSTTYTFVPNTLNPTWSYSWNFGDGSPINTTPSPTHTYSNSGTYFVLLEVNDGQGCMDSGLVTLFIMGGTPNCDASFSFQTLGNSNVVFFSVDNYDPFISYEWSLGDGNISNQAPALTYTYSQADTFNVCLLAYDAITGSCADTVCQTVITTGSGTGGGNCDANFIAIPDSNGNPLSFIFSPFTYNPNWNYSWDFGDGANSSNPVPTHTYAQAGTYTICLAVDDGAACVDSVCQSLVVIGQGGPCDASFVALQQPPNPIGVYVVDFMALNPQQQSFSWDFGDGTTGSQAFETHTYIAPGTYTVCLYTTDFNGCADSSCQSITLAPINLPCDASFSYLVQPNNEVDFFADYPGQNNYSWDFGDGNTASGTQVDHTYSAAGTYTVCLIVSDTIGSCIDTVCQNITTSPIMPPPGFAVLGQVYAGNQIADDFTAWLIVYDSTAGTLAAVDTFVSDSNNFGFFFFVAPNGDYRVKASLNPASAQYSSYMPTYYGDELLWSDAIVVNQNTFPFMQINLIPGNNPGGPGFVGGLVSQGANKAEGDPLSGMHVLITKDNNEAVIHTLTDENGEYEISNLAYGTYRIYIEMWGRSLEYHTVTIAPGQENHTDINFEVSNDAVTATGTTGLEDLIDPNTIRLYPNPLENGQDLSVQIGLKQSAEIVFSLQNMMGQTLMTETDRFLAGPQEKRMNVSAFSSGIYLLRLNVNGEPMAPLKIVIR